MVSRAFQIYIERERASLMATAPVKSQPLHNFSLPFLKWGGKNQMNNHRYRRPPVDPSRESPPMATASASEPESDGGGVGGGGSPSKNDSESETKKLSAAGSRTVRNNRFTFSSCSSSSPYVEKSQKHLAIEGSEVAEKESKHETTKNHFKNNSNTGDESGGGRGGDEVEETAKKPWNLRPRRAIMKTPIEYLEPNQHHHQHSHLPPVSNQTENLPKSMRLRGFAEAAAQSVEKKKEKRKFWISLSKEEIEEDIFIMTGSKPARRPKKRPKSVQKQLDSVFPGLWLVGVTADAYRVLDPPAKR